jgi:putative peptidoglycan lipid II flippase
MILVYPFFLWLGPVGCAAATSIAGWVNVILLWTGLRGSGFMGLSPGFTGRVLRLFLAAVVMGASVWLLARVGQDLLMAEGRFTKRFAVMGLLVSIGLLVYLVSVVALRVYSLGELRKRFRRRREA